jgi:hypothetical protein
MSPNDPEFQAYFDLTDIDEFSDEEDSVDNDEDD